jgi:Chaperone of endosialidase/Head domain of trimeric autotransporter adhesin
MQYITGSVAQTIMLPVVNNPTVANGFAMTINNKSSATISVYAAGGATALVGATYFPVSDLPISSSAGFPGNGTVYILSSTGIQTLSYYFIYQNDLLLGFNQGSGIAPYASVVATNISLVATIEPLSEYKFTCVSNTANNVGNVNGWYLVKNVRTITGTPNQVIASANTGAIVLSAPQDIATTSSPTFANLSITDTILQPNGIRIGDTNQYTTPTGTAVGNSSNSIGLYSVAIGNNALAGLAIKNVEATTTGVGPLNTSIGFVDALYNTLPIATTFTLGYVRYYTSYSASGSYTVKIFSGSLNGGPFVQLGAVTFSTIASPYHDADFRRLNLILTPGNYTVSIQSNIANSFIGIVGTTTIDNTNYPRFPGYGITLFIDIISFDSSGVNPIAIGHGATATADNSTAIGNGINGNVVGGMFLKHNPNAGGSGIGIAGFTATNELVEMPSILGAVNGGTGIDTSGATNGQLLIGSTGLGLQLGTLTAGTGVTITPGAGTITIDAAGGGVTTFQTTLSGLTPNTPVNGVVSLDGVLGPLSGGTGLDTSTAGYGQLLIGNGAGLSLSSLTAGTGVTITPGVGTITIDATATAGVTTFQTTLSGLTPNTPASGVVSLDGTLGQASGGTGINTSGATDGQLLIGSTGLGLQLGSLTAGTGITVTPSGGTVTITNNGVTSISGGTTGLTMNPAGTGAVTIDGTLGAANGGTGLNTTTATDGQLLIGSTGLGLQIGTLTAGAGITITPGAGTVTIAGSGITSVVGTTNQIDTTTTLGAVTVKLPNQINFSSQFVSIGAGGAPSHLAGLGGVCIGQSAATSVTGVDNVVIGGLTGQNLTTGQRNVLLGYGAAQNYNGDDLVCIGQGTLTGVTTSILSSTFVGSNAAKNLTSGVQNTFVGNWTNPALTTGGSNTFMGYGVASSLASSSENTFIGSEAAQFYTSMSGSRNTFIGARAGVGGPTTLTDANGYVTCIGADSRPSGTGAKRELTLGDPLLLTLRCAQALSVTSDGRDKTNVVPLDAGVQFVNALQPVRFTWNKRVGGDPRPDVGFIAQDLQSAQARTGINIPGFVNDSNPLHLEVTYDKLFPIMVKAIQDLSAQNATLMARLATIEARLP